MGGGGGFGWGGKLGGGKKGSGGRPGGKKCCAGIRRGKKSCAGIWRGKNSCAESGRVFCADFLYDIRIYRSEEHTSELQSP